MTFLRICVCVCVCVCVLVSWPCERIIMSLDKYLFRAPSKPGTPLEEFTGEMYPGFCAGLWGDS